MTGTDFSSRKKAGSRSPVRFLLWGGLVILMAALTWLLFADWLRPAETPTEQGTIVAEQAMMRDMNLYFSAEDGSHLVAEARSVEGCTDEGECLRAVIEALIAGPESGAVAVLPADTRLTGLAVEGPLVSLDFNGAFVSGHPGGTQSELLTVYALANSVAVNFPHLRQVRILVDGTPLETIKGHVDLRQPVSPDYSLVEETAAPGGDLSAAPLRSE